MTETNRHFGQALCWIAYVLLVFGPQHAHATSKKPHITGMFSNLGTVSEGGDLGGIEMWIVPSGQGYCVVFQESPDYPITPVVAKLTVQEDKISFVIPATSEFPGGFYKGRVTASGFEGTYSGKTALGKANEYAIHLKRRQTYWQTH